LTPTNGISDAEKHGGEVILGGAPLTNLKGYFMQPTLIKNMKTEMITTHEEVFAPILGMYEFDTEEKVIELANDCDVGLGSFVMTENIARSWRVAEALDVGMVGINLGMLSACESPFGGVKDSGYGREGGTQGLAEYMTVKSILVDVSY
jgi:succinate-semialdehyde dehydrogenase/glutarate-semialdehyde dehydrogenase